MWLGIKVSQNHLSMPLFQDDTCKALLTLHIYNTILLPKIQYLFPLSYNYFLGKKKPLKRDFFLNKFYLSLIYIIQ